MLFAWYMVFPEVVNGPLLQYMTFSNEEAFIKEKSPKPQGLFLYISYHIVDLNKMVN